MEPISNLHPPDAGAFCLVDNVIWREWDGAIVVFCEATGETHSLQGGEAVIFASLADKPTSKEFLVEELASLLAGGTREDAVRQVAQTIEALCRFNIIQPVSEQAATRDPAS